MKKLYFLAAALAALLPFCAIAQTDSTQNDLQNLLDMKFSEDQVRAYVKQENVSVASTNIQAEEEVASIISVITKKDIALYGYRDLSEILRFVPGFEYGIDGVNSAGQGFRGMWIYEGKGTLMLNGISINDPFYGNTNIMNQFPASMIERVEIIRGPGSVLYGGFSLVTVVNVITKNPNAQENLRLTTSGLTLDGKAYGTSNNASFNSHIGDLKISGNIGYSLHPTSVRRYKDHWGNEIQYGNKNTPRQSYYQTAQLEYKGLKLNYHHFDLSFTGQDGFDTVVARNSYGKNTEFFKNYSDAVLLKYESNFSKKVKIEPQLEFVRANPMFGAVSSFSQLNGSLLSNAVNHHWRGQIVATAQVSKRSELAGGGGFIFDRAYNRAANGAPAMYGNGGVTDTSRYSRQTRSNFGFVQYKYQFNSSWQAIAGVRFESNTFGDVSAPRAGIIFFQEPFNMKLLFSRAYRIPTPGQAFNSWIAYNDKLKPEESDNFEMELGYRFSDNISFKTNVYNFDVHDAILWNGGQKSYVNSNKLQLWGVEGTLNAVYTKWGGFMNFAYTKPTQSSSADFATTDGKHTLGLPPLKVNIGAHYRYKKLQLGATGTYLSERYGPSQAYAQQALINPNNSVRESVSYPHLFMANVNVTVNQIAKNLNVNLVASNIFNSKYVLIQPYYAGHAPVPANDRQITLSFTYEFSK